MADIKVRIFLTAEDAGLGKNGNYSDSSGRTYSWDTYVQNHAKPQVGDIVIVRSKSHVLGVSMISEIAKEPSYKTRLRCSVCASTKLKWSRPKRAFRCACKEISEIPQIEYLGDVESYQASYEWFFTPLPDLAVDEIRNVAEKSLSIHSIQTANTSKAMRLLPELALWRLGFIEASGLQLRRNIVSLGHVFSDAANYAEVCEISGVNAPGQIVTMKAITYSVSERRFTVDTNLNVLGAIANAVQRGDCQYLAGTDVLVVKFATPDGLSSFTYPTRAASPIAKKWLENYQGLGND